MVGPIDGKSSAMIELERARAYQQEPDHGKNLELAMAATIFRDLQNAGYIPVQAKLADEPPQNPSGLKGTSYEARLVELITDQNQNGKLDLDLDRLRTSGILSTGASNQELEGVLTGQLRTQLSDAFIQGQDVKSELTDRFRTKSDKGRAVQAYSTGMQLSSARERQQLQALQTLQAGAAGDASSATRAASSALAQAQVLKERGDQAGAQTLLAKTGRYLMDAGHLTPAKQVFTALLQEPYAKAPCNLVQARVDRMRAKDPAFRVGQHVIEIKSAVGNEVRIDPKRFSSTHGALAGSRLQQIAMTERMQATLGRSADPRNLDDARAYFQAFSQGRSTEAVRGELQNYLTHFHSHSGDDVKWSPNIAQDERPARLAEVLRAQPVDDMGRKIIDCEGYTYLTAHLLGDIRGADGKPRFEVSYASKLDHVIAGVKDQRSGEAFTVNNNDCESVGKPKNRLAFDTAVARELCRGYPDIISIGRRPSEGWPSSLPPGGVAMRPKLGALVYDGQQLAGTVDHDLLARYETFAKRELNATFNRFLVGGGASDP